MKKIILIIILLLCLSIVYSIDESLEEIKEINKTKPTIKYTFNTKTVENDGIYNIIIGKDWYADENGTLMKDLSSLKSCQFCDNIKLVINEDKDYPVEIIDYNMTSIRFNILNSEKVLGISVPIKILDKSNITNVLIDTVSSKMDESDLEDTKEILSDFGMDKIIKIGSNSTTIILTNNDILADSYISAASPTTNYGTVGWMYLLDSGTPSYVKEALIKFNTTFQENTTFLNSKINIYLGTNNLDTTSEGYYISFREINTTYSWTETGVTWNNKPSESLLGSKTEHKRFRSDSGTGYYTFQVNNILSKSVYNGYTNTSFYIDVNDNFGTPASTDYLVFYSSDYVGIRPFLNVTYEIKNFNQYIINTSSIYEQSVLDGSNLAILGKVNISSIPQSKIINEVYYCNYIAFVQSTPDFDTEIRRIDNRTWTVPATDFVYTNYSNTSTFSSVGLNDHTCLNITNIIKEDYILGNDISSFEINDLDYKVNLAGISVVNPDLYIGQAGASPQLVFSKKGGNNFYLPTSYLKVFYSDITEPLTPISFYQLNCTDTTATDTFNDLTRNLLITGSGYIIIQGQYHFNKTYIDPNCKIYLEEGGAFI